MELIPEDLSSDWTFIYKFLFAPLWIGGFGFGSIGMLIADIRSSHHNGPQDNPWFIFFIIFLFGATYLYWTCIRLKLVRIDSDFIYISNFRKEIKVPLYQIKKVSEWRLDNSHPIFIYFTQTTEFGTSIVFMPKIRWFGFWSSHPVVDKIRQASERNGIHPT